jgi:hypothetical protein
MPLELKPQLWYMPCSLGSSPVPSGPRIYRKTHWLEKDYCPLGCDAMKRHGTGITVKTYQTTWRHISEDSNLHSLTHSHTNWMNLHWYFTVTAYTKCTNFTVSTCVLDPSRAHWLHLLSLPVKLYVIQIQEKRLNFKLVRNNKGETKQDTIVNANF